MNHLTHSLITKGFIYSFPLTRGIIVNYEIITPSMRRIGGGSYDQFLHDIKKIENITSIKVYVNWWKKVNKNKKISVQILEKKIEADIIKETNIKEDKIEIKVISLYHDEIY